MRKAANMFNFDMHTQSIIIFSDQHKGCKETVLTILPPQKNYIAALEYYNEKNFYFVNLGDSEELWENTIFTVMKHNGETFFKGKIIHRSPCILQDHRQS